MVKNILKLVTRICFFVFIAAGSFLFAELKPSEIMDAVLKQGSSEDQVMKVKMTLVSEGNKTHERTATLYSKRKKGEDDMRLIYFHTPLDMADNGVLTIENSNRDNDQWAYIPAYHTVRRIASSNLTDNYMGTDYSYEDAADPITSKYLYKIVSNETIRDTVWTVISAVPVNKKLKSETAYSEITYWVDPVKYVVSRTIYRDKDGKMFKELVNSDLKSYETKEGVKYRWERTEMKNIKTKHKTITEVTSIKIDSGISENIFTERYLKTGK
ncbi:MAG: hypothetical protein A2452_03635 [Candidatus Firestonebacteria bacterium RIFOXYC2_FULL_39_67]|nr:MAG: hypothetical protein A2536_00460 [Candidatus Firestonebacteria bacterium RIFOXYD2_FULL_39_29]OGF51934.1 MAG: hypothetical protein A2497_07625 [Candidatus Firestonebacteria bacterium RifOxyC12_full_39_7]OGF57094.1 MAG: hypothetical protein A2452_03635 [Candidatus Firestonebacteria bacterium RIFOXYC2_FULL_39_67]